MGVKGLFNFLQRFEQTVHIPTFVKNKIIGIDIFHFIHQSKGDFFALQQLLLPYINNSKKVYCVFDGTPSLQKQEELKEINLKRNERLESIKRIEEFMRFPFNNLNSESRKVINQYINELKKETWIPTPAYIDSVKIWLKKKECEIYEAVNEADNVLVELEIDGTIELIITNDSDILVLGGNNILRPKNSLRASYFNSENIYKEFGFTKQQWSDFMYLCKYMKNDDIILAYSFVSVYKDLDLVLQKYYILYNDYLIRDVS